MARLVAQIRGEPVDRVKAGLHVLCAILAGFGGVLLTSLAGSASPTNAMGAELPSIGSAELRGVSPTGGTGSVLGTVLGTLVLGFINNGMTLSGMRTHWHIVTRGAVLMLAVTLDSLRTGGLRLRR